VEAKMQELSYAYTSRDQRGYYRGTSRVSWKFSINAKLKVCAKIIFSILVSSAGVERLLVRAACCWQYHVWECCLRYQQVSLQPVREKVQKVNETFVTKCIILVNDKACRNAKCELNLEWETW